MKWDNWGLPVDDNGNQGKSCQQLANYFININCYKKHFDNEFKKNHPQRERLAGETVEDYDNYLTQHLNAYRDLLNSKDIQYMQDADLHFSDKLNSLLYHSVELTIHPQLGRVMNRQNLAPMLVCLFIYGFTDTLNHQDTRHAPQLKDIQQGRSNRFYRFAGDAIRFVSVIFKDQPDVHIPYLVLNKVTNTETWLAKLTKKIFFTKYKNYGSLWDTTIEWLKT